jgi:hypothetical protein
LQDWPRQGPSPGGAQSEWQSIHLGLLNRVLNSGVRHSVPFWCCIHDWLIWVLEFDVSSPQSKWTSCPAHCRPNRFAESSRTLVHFCQTTDSFQLM